MLKVIEFLLSFRLYLYNFGFNRIPFSTIRLLFVRQYINLGKNSNVLMNVKILHSSLKKNLRITIGDNCVINQDCLLDSRGGNIYIGNNVDIARGTWIFTLEHDPNSDYHETVFGNVTIEENVWIASRVIILPGVRIGNGSVIAAGSIVTKDIPAMCIAAGIPAKVIGERKSKLKYRHNYFPYFS